MKLNTSRPARRALCIAIFVLLLLGNFLTPRLVDDWTYGFSFATGEPILSLGDIITSMRVHSQAINGRLFAHFLVQIFEYLPKAVFNVLNAGVFLGLILLLYRLCRREGEDSNLLLACLFGAVWVFTPTFGQAFLWLDGSCNYGWGSALGLWWLLPYVRRFLHPEERRPGWKWGAWCLLGFLAGGYLENISAAVIFLAALLLLLTRLHKKEKNGLLPWLGIAAAVAGFLFMLTRPAELGKGLGEEALTLTRLGIGFIVSLKAYASLRIPVLFFRRGVCAVLSEKDGPGPPDPRSGFPGGISFFQHADERRGLLSGALSGFPGAAADRRVRPSVCGSLCRRIQRGRPLLCRRAAGVAAVFRRVWHGGRHQHVSGRPGQ